MTRLTAARIDRMMKAARRRQAHGAERIREIRVELQVPAEDPRFGQTVRCDWSSPRVAVFEVYEALHGAD